MLAEMACVGAEILRLDFLQRELKFADIEIRVIEYRSVTSSKTFLEFLKFDFLKI